MLELVELFQLDLMFLYLVDLKLVVEHQVPLEMHLNLQEIVLTIVLLHQYLKQLLLNFVLLDQYQVVVQQVLLELELNLIVY